MLSKKRDPRLSNPPLPINGHTDSMRPLIAMIRAYQRHKQRRVWLLVFLTILVSAFLVIDHESYKGYTTSSLQHMNEQIAFLSDKINEWKNDIDTVAAVDQKEASATSATSATSAYESVSLETLVVSNGGIEAEVTQTKEVDNAESETGEAVKGVLVMFARNMELNNILETIRTVEERFNRKYLYDWVFINDAAHSQSFIKMTSSLIASDVKYVHVSRKEYFTAGSSVYGRQFKTSRSKLRKNKVKGKATLKVKLIQKFWLYDIFQLKELQEYDYFMRINPGVELLCDINLDLFKFMRNNLKSYGFGFSELHTPNIFETLWPETLKYITNNPGAAHENSLIDFISDDNGISYNYCQFESAFEIGSLKFFRSKRYSALVNHFIEQNEFFYEDWQDSTIRTLAVSLLEDKSNLQFFNNLGFDDFQKGIRHNSCPFDASSRASGRCVCDPMNDITWAENSCIEKFYKVNNAEIPKYVGMQRTLMKENAMKPKKENAELATDSVTLGKEENLKI